MARNSLIVSLLLFTLSYAHSNLRFPEPYNEDRYQPGNAFECKASVRCGPCSLLPDLIHKLPITTWKRGERVDIQWHRNNHRDGFYRRSIIPIKHIMNWKAHEKLAFDYGCHSQGTFLCKFKRDKWQERCGADNHNPPRLHRNFMKVPNIYPDGRYVFAQTWYGGSDRTGDRNRGAIAKFSNFAMCSIVDIKGGSTGNTTPITFHHGKRDNFNPTGKGTLGPMQCWSTSDRMGECGGAECKGVKLSAMTPATFRNENGQRIVPKPLKRDDVMHFINTEPDYDMRSAYKEDVFPGWRDKKKNGNDKKSSGQKTSDSYNNYGNSYGKSDVSAGRNEDNKKRRISGVGTPYPKRQEGDKYEGLVEPAPLDNTRSPAWRWTSGKKWEMLCGKWKKCFHYCERNEAECLSIDEL